MRAAPNPLAMLTLLALTGLAGCSLPPYFATPAVQKAAQVPPLPRPVPAVVAPSALSQATRDYYAGVQTGLLMQGLLRTDRGGRDTPFTDRNLTDNFIQVALFDEYAETGGKLVQRKTPGRLRRWEQPVRLAVEFGASVPLPQRGKDVADVAAFAGELARASGHPVALSPDAPNFTVLILNEDERRAAAPRLRALVPGISPLDLATVTGMPPETYCLVFAYSNSSTSTYDQAVAVIRGEHPDLLRLTCIHEELAQGMGLANDSPAARPSVFNDDEEFALLTRQDAMMLKMLYDRRLTPGMMPEQARPIAATIAAELLGGQS